MTYYEWNREKNLLLRREHGVTFEQIVMHIGRGDLLDVIRHPNIARCPHQKVLVVRIEEYVYTVPFVEDEEKRFLKTIIPSHKLTRQYLGECHEES